MLAVMVSETSSASPPLVLWLAETAAGDTASVGGKNASLGEMISSLASSGMRVPDGFAATAAAYWAVLDANQLRPSIARLLGDLAADPASLQRTGAAVRDLIATAVVPGELRDEIVASYHHLCASAGVPDVDVAVRSSATAEDLPEASFAGQHESYLNVSGADAVVAAVRDCMASLFTDRAISYRDAQGFDHMKVALSVGVQRMVRSDLGAAGVMFTLDTETGFSDVVQIDAAWGLGEMVVKGTVSPDRYTVFKPFLAEARLKPVIARTLGAKADKMIYASGSSRTTTVETDAGERDRFVLDIDEIVQLARWAVLIEAHYGHAMDIEWAKDGDTGELFIVQARPETVQTARKPATMMSYRLARTGARLTSGVAIGEGVAVGCSPAESKSRFFGRNFWKCEASSGTFSSSGGGHRTTVAV